MHREYCWLIIKHLVLCSETKNIIYLKNIKMIKKRHATKGRRQYSIQKERMERHK